MGKFEIEYKNRQKVKNIKMVRQQQFVKSQS